MLRWGGFPLGFIVWKSCVRLYMFEYVQGLFMYEVMNVCKSWDHCEHECGDGGADMFLRIRLHVCLLTAYMCAALEKQGVWLSLHIPL